MGLDNGPEPNPRLHRRRYDGLPLCGRFTSNREPSRKTSKDDATSSGDIDRLDAQQKTTKWPWLVLRSRNTVTQISGKPGCVDSTGGRKALAYTCTRLDAAPAAHSWRPELITGHLLAKSNLIGRC